MHEDFVAGIYPTAQSIRDLVESALKRVEEATQNRASLAARHNAFTDYCLALLFFCTGHRATIDPFQSMQYFDLSNQWMLIADKVIVEERAWRIVALPTLASNQIKKYLNYLFKLAACLRQDPIKPEYWMEVQRLACGEDKCQLPLFFYLTPDLASWQQISPKEIAHRWSTYWALPIYFIRHVTATELLKSSRRADWVQIQLGHIDGLDHPLGKTGTESTVQTLDKIRVHMDAIVKQQGWRCIGAPIRMLSTGFVTKLPKLSEEIKILGEEKRRNERMRNRSRASELVRELLHQRTHFSELDTVDEAGYNEMIAQIATHAKVESLSVNYCLRLAARYLSRVAGKNRWVRRMAATRFIDPEPSPFDRDSIKNYKKLEKLRENFLTYLHSQGVGSAAPTQGRRVAEIMIASSIFSGLHKKNCGPEFQDALLKGTYQLDGQLFVDIGLCPGIQAPIHRWFPDPISASLILGFKNRFGSLECKLAQQSVHKEVCDILKEIQVGLGDPLRMLEKLSDVGITFEVPGFLAGVLRGDVKAVSLPLPQLIRMRADHRLCDSGESDREGILFHEDVWLPDISRASKNAGTDRAEEFQKIIQGGLTQSSMIRHVGNQGANKKCKQAFYKFLKERFAKCESWSSLHLSIVAWAAYLCINGTRRKKDIAYGTIVKYLPMITRVLTNLAESADFLSMSDIAFEELYLRALLYQHAHRRVEFLSRLQEFHDFLVTSYEIDEPHWDAIMAESGAVAIAKYADANMASFEEYHQILICVWGDKNLTKKSRIQYCSLLLFGYRFGLRFGEAWRLQFRDVQQDHTSSQVHLVIRNGIFGDVKSSAGVRIVPLLEKLTLLESEVLGEVLNLGEGSFNEDPLCPLMAKDNNTRTLIDRHIATQYLQAVLRGVTGDERLRYQHLRHSWATRMFAQQFVKRGGSMHPFAGIFLPMDFDDNAGKAFIGSGQAVYPLRSISTAIGHAEDRTTVASYVHCVDLVCGDLYRQAAPALSDFASAYCIGIAHATVRGRRRRHSIDDAHALTMNSRIASKIDVPNVSHTARSTQCPSVQTTVSSRSIGLVDIDNLLRRYSDSIGNIGVIADRFLIERDLASEIMAVAEKIERISGYTKYKLEDKKEDPILDSGSTVAKQSSFSLLENSRMKVLLPQIEKQLKMAGEQGNNLAPGIDVWARTYRQTNKSNFITEFEELSQFLFVIRLLFPGSGILVQLHKDLKSHNTLTHLLEQLDCQLEWTSIARAQERSKKRATGRAEVRLNPPKIMYGTLGTVHRIIFLIAIFLSL